MNAQSRNYDNKTKHVVLVPVSVFTGLHTVQ